VRLVPDTPPVPGEAAALAETVAGLRTANTRLRELLAERDARVAVLEAELEGLRAQVADLAAQVKRNSSVPRTQRGVAVGELSDAVLCR
jgi:chromosome segregation ATPase